jgi:hypothetical protein
MTTTDIEHFKRTIKALRELASCLDAGQCDVLDKEAAPLLLKRGAGLLRLHKSRAGAPRVRTPNTERR